MCKEFRIAEPDIYGQLQQKERDLILAAELGKALLEKNEELSKQNEKIAEDFSQKLEVKLEFLSGNGVHIRWEQYEVEF